MNYKELISILPERYRSTVEKVVNNMENLPLMDYPYFGVLPIDYNEKGKCTILKSKLTSLSVSRLVTTSYGFTSPIEIVEIPVMDQFKSIFNCNMINTSNVKAAINNAETKSDLTNMLKWTYLKGREMIMLKICELFTTLKHGNISPPRLSSILNNIAGMSSEYKMFHYDPIGNKVVFPDDFEYIDIKPNKAISIVDCPQNEKQTYRLCIGAKVKNGKVSNGKYAISDVHALCPCPDKIIPNRLVVQRAITQAMHINEPEIPLVEGIRGKLAHMATANLLSARMEYKGFTHEDGLVVSKSASNRLKATTIHLDSIDGTQEDVKIVPLYADREFIMNHYESLLNTLMGTTAYIGRNKIIATNKFGTNTITSLKVPGIVTGILDINGKTYVESIAMHELNIGDKIMDMHGNKGVVSAIIPDKLMPSIKVKGGKVPIDIIFPPYTVKRCDPSREIEEALSMNLIRSQFGLATERLSTKPIKNIKRILEAVKHNNIIFTRQAYGYNVNYDVNVEEVYMNNKIVNIPVGIVRIARVNHIARQKLSYYTKSKYNNQGIQLKNGYSMADNMFHLYKNSCTQTIRDILKDSKPGRLRDLLFTLGYIITENGTKRIRKTLTINPTTDEIPKFVNGRVIVVKDMNEYPKVFTPDNLDVESKGTVLDTRSKTCFTAYKIPKWLNCTISIDKVNMEIKGGDYLLIPPLNVFNLSDGTATPNTIQNLIIRLGTQIKSRVGTDVKLNSCRSLIFALYATISGKLFKKNGVIRNTLFPRTGFTAYGVIVPNPDLAIDEILIPYQLMKSFAKSFGKKMKKMYNINEQMSATEMDVNIKGFVLSTRFPAHEERNMIALRPRIWKESAIGINPAIAPIQDGDYDGDMEMLYFPKTIGSMEEIKRFTIDQHLSKKQSKIIRSKSIRTLHPKYESVANVFELDTLSKELKMAYYMSTGFGEERIETDRYRMMKKGINIETIGKRVYKIQTNARHEFSYMKRGAANSGNIGLSLRSMSVTSKGMEMANNIYATLANMALDSKNSEGKGSFVDIACEAIRMGDPLQLKKILGPECKELTDIQKEYIRTKLQDGNRLSGVARLVTRRHPIAHATMTGTLRDIENGTDIKANGPYEYLYRQISKK